MKLGPYTVVEGLRHDNPAWPLFLIYKGDALIGKQFSRPCLSDCEWLDRERGVYATSSNETRKGHAYSLQPKRRGRPRKADAERELEEAMTA